MIPFIESYPDFLMSFVAGFFALAFLICCLVISGRCADNEEPPQFGGPPHLPRD